MIMRLHADICIRIVLAYDSLLMEFNFDCRKQLQSNAYYEDLSQFNEVKKEDSLNMEPCAAYEGVQVMQQCPAYDVVSEYTTKKDQTELHKLSSMGNADNKEQDYVIMTDGPIYQCIDAKV